MSFVSVCQITPRTQKRWALRLVKILFSIFLRSSASNIGRKVRPDLAPLTQLYVLSERLKPLLTTTFEQLCW